MIEKSVSIETGKGPAAKFAISRHIPEDQVVIGDLLDGNGNVIQHNAYFHIPDAPFSLSAAEIEYVERKEPNSGWPKALIQQWMREMQHPDEQGNVPKTDPFYFSGSETKTKLLAKIAKALHPEGAV